MDFSFERWLIATICVSSLACAVAKNDDPATTETTADEQTTDETVIPIACDQAIDEAQCASVKPEFENEPGCLWVPIVSFGKVEPTCEKTVVGGLCVAYAGGDTDCGGQAAACGFDVYLAQDGAGFRIARIDEGCSYYLGSHGPSDFDLLRCADLESMTDEVDPEVATEMAACACGCASDYPN